MPIMVGSMGAKKNNISKDVIVYGAGHALGQVVPFLLIPIYTRILSTAEYGIIDVIVAFSAMVMLVTSLGIPAAQTFYFFLHKEKEWAKNLLSTTAFLRFIITTTCVFILILFRRQVLNAISVDLHYERYFVIALVAVPFDALFSVFTNTCRMTFKKYSFVGLNLFKAVSTATLAIILLVGMDMGMEGIFYARLISAVAAVFVGYLVTREYFAVVLNWEISRKVILYGIPLLVGYLSTWVLQYSDRYFLLRNGFDGGLGEYALAYKMSAVVMLFAAAFRTAWTPFAFDNYHKNSNAPLLFAKALELYVVIAGFIALMMVLFARPVMIFIVPQQYWGAGSVVSYLVYSAVVWQSVVIISLGVMLTKHTIYSTIAFTVAAIVNIGLNAYLVPTHGIVGAALSTLISYIIAIGILYASSQKFYRIPYKICRVVLFLTAIFIMSSVVELSTWGDVSIELIKRAFVISVAVALVFLLKLISPNEFMALVRKPLRAFKRSTPAEDSPSL
jgi:O-antigen/teichoic acid export membrane protein